MILEVDEALLPRFHRLVDAGRGGDLGIMAEMSDKGAFVTKSCMGLIFRNDY